MPEKTPEEIEAERLDMLRSLDVDAAITFYNRYNLGGPRQPDKVMVRVHKERIASTGLTDEERAASQQWIDDRIARGRQG